MERDTIVIDSGALSALAEGDEAVRKILRTAIEAEFVVVVPTVVIAESTTGRGTRDAKVNRVLRALGVVDLDERLARQAAFLRARVRGSSIADAIVVATADRFAAAIVLTGDGRDLKALSLVHGRTRIIAF